MQVENDKNLGLHLCEDEYTNNSVFDKTFQICIRSQKKNIHCVLFILIPLDEYKDICFRMDILGIWCTIKFH